MTIVAIVLSEESEGWANVVTIVLVLLLAGAYAVFGRTAVRYDEVVTRQGYIYAGAIILLYTPAVLMDAATATAIFALAPQIFMCLRPVLASARLVIVLVPPLIGLLDPANGNPLFGGLFMMAVIAASVLLGTFIDRITRQSAERARLIDELDRTRDELAEVSMAAGRLAERERLAGELHDTLAQGLTAVITVLQAADPDIPLAVRTAKENLNETRALIEGATPPALDGASLEGALDRLVGRAAVPAGLVVSGDRWSLPDEVEVALLRTAQEALANVRKHAAAGSVRVRLRYDADAVRLEVADDGRGFAPDGAGGTEGGYGLRGMRGRMERLGGALTVRSAPGAGTTITVEISRA